MTVAANFTDTERDLLIRLPRWIVAAASAAQHDNAARTHAEIEAGFIAIANGRQAGSAFVAEIARAAMDVFDDDPAASGIRTDTEGGIDAVLERARTASQLLRAKADAPDASAYAQWLLDITDEVITATRSDDVLGFGGVLVSPAEQRFRDRLAEIVG